MGEVGGDGEWGGESEKRENGWEGRGGKETARRSGNRQEGDIFGAYSTAFVKKKEARLGGERKAHPIVKHRTRSHGNALPSRRTKPGREGHLSFFSQFRG